MEKTKMKKNIKLYKFNEIDSTNEYLRKNHKSYEEFDVISGFRWMGWHFLVSF